TLGADFRYEEIPAELLDDAKRARARLVETLADTDDQVMAKYLQGHVFTAEELQRAIRAATVRHQVVPVVCGSAFKNKGVQPLLDAVVDYLPSPADIPAMAGAAGTE